MISYSSEIFPKMIQIFMDVKMRLKLVAFLIAIFQVSTALQVNITEEQCGRTIDISGGQSVYFNYDGAWLWDSSPKCVIRVKTNHYDEKICIRRNKPPFIDAACMWTLSYFVGRYEGDSYHSRNEHTCSDFKYRPLCDDNYREASLEYVENHFYNYTGVSIHVRVYTKKMITTTTRRIYTQSQWSSRSSSYESNQGKKPKSLKGLWVGLICVGAAFLACCFCWLIRGSVCPDAENYTSPVPENEPLSQSERPAPSAPSTHFSQGNESVNLTENSASGYSPHQHSYNPNSNIQQPAYHPVPTEDSSTGKGSDLPPPSYDSLPSAPPPPYPGY